jgi:ATP-dependent DNA helicase RecG
MKGSQHIEWKQPLQEASLKEIRGFTNAFFRAGYIESWGRGIEKIHRECREHGIEPPVYDFGMAGLMLTFQANPAHLPAAASEHGGRGATRETTPIATPITTPNQLVSMILAKPEISQKELAEALGLTRDGIKYHLTKMKRNAVVRHVGPARGGRWEVLK